MHCHKTNNQTHLPRSIADDFLHPTRKLFIIPYYICIHAVVYRAKVNRSQLNIHVRFVFSSAPQYCECVRAIGGRVLGYFNFDLFYFSLHKKVHIAKMHLCVLYTNKRELDYTHIAAQRFCVRARPVLC